MGAGDEVPDALRQIGCEVTLLSADDLARGDLSRFDAIVTGVRAFNMRADLRANYQRLFNYVAERRHADRAIQRARRRAVRRRSRRCWSTSVRIRSRSAAIASPSKKRP